jgi:hypothetical protein
MIHQLKIEPRWLHRIRANEKHCEVRLNDRDYQAGDDIIVRTENYDTERRRITHVLHGADGLHPGYVVLSLEDSRVDQLPRLEREVERLTRSNRSLRAYVRKLAGGAS